MPIPKPRFIETGCPIEALGHDGKEGFGIGSKPTSPLKGGDFESGKDGVSTSQAVRSFKKLGQDKVFPPPQYMTTQRRSGTKKRLERRLTGGNQKWYNSLENSIGLNCNDGGLLSVLDSS